MEIKDIKISADLVYSVVKNSHLTLEEEVQFSSIIYQVQKVVERAEKATSLNECQTLISKLKEVHKQAKDHKTIKLNVKCFENYYDSHIAINLLMWQLENSVSEDTVVLSAVGSYNASEAKKNTIANIPMLAFQFIGAISQYILEKKAKAS